MDGRPLILYIWGVVNILVTQMYINIPMSYTTTQSRAKFPPTPLYLNLSNPLPKKAKHSPITTLRRSLFGSLVCYNCAGGEDIYLSEALGSAKGQLTAPGSRFTIVSGVGSGKTTFIEELIKTSSPSLVMTSRKIKRQEMVAGTAFEDTIVSTNHKVAYAIRNNNEDFLKKVKQLRLVVLDEAHSPVSDRSFANYLPDLTEFFDLLSPSASIIFMTATPQQLPCWDWYRRQNFSLLDMSTKCHATTVAAKRVLRVSNDTAHMLMAGMHRYAYYSPNAKTMGEMAASDGPSSVLLTAGFDFDEDIGLVTVDSNVRATSHIPDIEKSKRSYRSIVEHSTLPDSIERMYCTSAFREGVNIYSDIDTVFVEASSMLEVRQFCGRFRNGVDTVYVVVPTYRVPNFDSDEKAIATAEWLRRSKPPNNLFSSFLGNIPSLSNYLRKSSISGEVTVEYDFLNQKMSSVAMHWDLSRDFKREARKYFGDDVFVGEFGDIPRPKKRVSREVGRRIIESKVSFGEWFDRKEEERQLRELSSYGLLNSKGKPYGSLNYLANQYGFKISRMGTKGSYEYKKWDWD